MRVESVITESDGWGIKETYRLGTYEVQKRVGHSFGPNPRPVAWLRIRSLGPILHDWRDLQEIKTLLCGPDFEAVEIYPPEADLVDANDYFHLWVFLDGYRMPFGFRQGRCVSDPRLNPPHTTLAVPQREFATLPPDAVDSATARLKVAEGRPPFQLIKDSKQQ